MFKRLTLKEKWIFLTALTVTVFLFLGFVWLYISQNTGIITKDDYTFFYYGNTKTISEGARLDTTDDGTGLINKELTNNVPLVSKDNVLVTCDMIYYRLSSYRIEVLPQYSQIQIDDNSNVTFVDDFDKHTSFSAEPGFLYDGNSIYIFLQEVDLNYNGKTVTLSPLSFLCYTKDCVSYYDFEKQKGYMETLYLDEVSATCEAYKLVVDSAIYYQKDTNILLFTDTSILNSVFK